jgi:hypothetical protein
VEVEMGIENSKKYRTAQDEIFPALYGLWMRLGSMVTADAIEYTTVYSWHRELERIHARFDEFQGNHGTWLASRYPEESALLVDAIASLGRIVSDLSALLSAWWVEGSSRVPMSAPGSWISIDDTQREQARVAIESELEGFDRGSFRV